MWTEKWKNEIRISEQEAKSMVNINSNNNKNNKEKI